jgi:hypothetical protein
MSVTRTSCPTTPVSPVTIGGSRLEPPSIVPNLIESTCLPQANDAVRPRPRSVRRRGGGRWLRRKLDYHGHPAAASRTDRDSDHDYGDAHCHRDDNDRKW